MLHLSPPHQEFHQTFSLMLRIDQRTMPKRESTHIFIITGILSPCGRICKHHTCFKELIISQANLISQEHLSWASVREYKPVLGNLNVVATLALEGLAHCMQTTQILPACWTQRNAGKKVYSLLLTLYTDILISHFTYWLEFQGLKTFYLHPLYSSFIHKV